MRLATLISDFLRAEDGAITVDWVVVSAATIGLAMAITAGLGGATHDYAETVSSAMSSRGVPGF